MRERDMLIDIVSKIGINSAFQIGKNQASETDQALVCSVSDFELKFCIQCVIFIRFLNVFP